MALSNSALFEKESEVTDAIDKCITTSYMNRLVNRLGVCPSTKSTMMISSMLTHFQPYFDNSFSWKFDTKGRFYRNRKRSISLTGDALRQQIREASLYNFTVCTYRNSAGVYSICIFDSSKAIFEFAKSKHLTVNSSFVDISYLMNSPLTNVNKPSSCCELRAYRNPVRYFFSPQLPPIYSDIPAYIKYVLDLSDSNICALLPYLLTAFLYNYGNRFVEKNSEQLANVFLSKTLDPIDEDAITKLLHTLSKQFVFPTGNINWKKKISLPKPAPPEPTVDLSTLYDKPWESPSVLCNIFVTWFRAINKAQKHYQSYCNTIDWDTCLQLLLHHVGCTDWAKGYNNNAIEFLEDKSSLWL